MLLILENNTTDWRDVNFVFNQVSNTNVETMFVDTHVKQTVFTTDKGPPSIKNQFSLSLSEFVNNDKLRSHFTFRI